MAENAVEGCTHAHMVRRGDTLFRLGTRYGVPWREIQLANGIRGTILRVGRLLCIPGNDATKPEILSFTVNNPNPKQGETVVFSWQSRGLSKVNLAHQNQLGNLTNRGLSNLAPNGSASFVFTTNDEATQRFTLSGGLGGVTQKELSVKVPCLRPLFFKTTEVPGCPTEDASKRHAVYEPFERGFMLWLPRTNDEVSRNRIFVFAANGTGSIVDDAFLQGEPETDPNIVAPPGKLQPVRGFGKAWRSGYRDQLGWALSLEAGYTMTTQGYFNPPYTTYEYWTLPSGEVLRVSFERMGSGRVFNWSRVQTAT